MSDFIKKFKTMRDYQLAYNSLDKPNLIYVESNGIVDFNPEDRIIAKINLEFSQNVIITSYPQYFDYFDVDGVRYGTGTTQINLSAGEHTIKYKHNTDTVLTTNAIGSLVYATSLIIPEGIKKVNMGLLPSFSQTTIKNSITLPESTEQIIDSCNIQGIGESYMVCKAKTPPTIDEEQGAANLYVPAESVNSYRIAQYWSGFQTISPIEANKL